MFDYSILKSGNVINGKIRMSKESLMDYRLMNGVVFINELIINECFGDEATEIIDSLQIKLELNVLNEIDSFDESEFMPPITTVDYEIIIV
jgi:hypothetical protein